MAERHRGGRPVDLRDTMVAGIVLPHRAAIATRNVRHFQGPPGAGGQSLDCAAMARCSVQVARNGRGRDVGCVDAAAADCE